MVNHLKRVTHFINLGLLFVPVFYMFGPNGVGYETILITDTHDTAAIQQRDTVACNYVTSEGDHVLIEGVVFNTEPFLLLADNPLYGILSDEGAEFCLVKPGSH